MDRSLLSLTNDVCFCVSGTVTIHPTAAIATNVVLHANPGSRIVIGAGAVIGRGCILHAAGGTLNVDSEVVLGTKVLLVGCGSVGKNACIGPMTTIMTHINVQPGQLIPSNSLIGVPEPGLQSVPVATASSAPGTVSGSKSTLPCSSFAQPHDSQGINEDDQTKARIDALLKDVQSHGSQYNKEDNHHDKGDECQRDVHEFDDKDSVEYESSHPGHERDGQPVSVRETKDDRTVDKPPGQQTNQQTEQHIDTGHVKINQTTAGQSKTGRADEQADVDQADVDQADVEQNVVPNSTPSQKSVVYGQASVQRLITMMFPHRSLDTTGEDKE